MASEQKNFLLYADGKISGIIENNNAKSRLRTKIGKVSY